MTKQELKDVIIVLPGIMGSVLEKGDAKIWAFTCGAISSGLLRDTLSENLPIRSVDDDDYPKGGIRATSLLEVPSIFPRLVKSDGYSSLRAMIASIFKVKADDGTPGNYYEFPYDWRLDNRLAARELQSYVERVLPSWRRFSGYHDAKVILITHSMGGLVGRYYCEVLGGWENSRAFITLGTPHRGSLNAVDSLANGPGWPFQWLAPIIRTFPSVHQLLPIYEVIEVDGGRRRVAEGICLPGIDPKLADDALDFHREIERAVASNRADASYHEEFRIIPFVGTDQPTKQWSFSEDGRLIVRRDCPSWLDPLLGGGDGTVPLISAIPIELSDSAATHFVPEHHGMLQSNVRLHDMLIGLLKQLLSKGLSAIRGPCEGAGAIGGPAISVDVEDVHLAGSPVEIRTDIRCAARSPDVLEGIITPVDRLGTVIRGRICMSEDNGVWRVDGLSEGMYCVEIRSSSGGQDSPTPVRDLFEVIRDGGQ